ncbi:MAG: prolyl oligopeptidase family serine peptidase, partial [Rhodothermales bacterium]|nr:prolyl oligopeptidase family serine peptidase [Rhodothermales bacterium]
MERLSMITRVVRPVTISTGTFLSILLLAAATATAQTPERPVVVTGDGVLITEGLLIPGWDYFQSAWRLDPVERSRVQGLWAPPSAGTRIDSAHTWQPVQADSSGWIAHPNLRGGYLYAEVQSESERIVILEGFGYRRVLVNGEPRAGNVYGFKERWESWEPQFDFSFVPVRLKAGSNEFLFVGGRAPRMKATLHELDTPYVLNARDATLPDLIVGEKADYQAAVALINTTESTARGLVLMSSVGDDSQVETTIPDLPPLSVRKVGFRIEAPVPAETGTVVVQLAVQEPGANEPVESATIELAVRDPHENHRRTFVSSIDGSVQYYGFNPARIDDAHTPPALVLSVHGAAVEAINQSGSYRAKTWAHIVAPTNRRPYGFNWEDWGRLDALEVLSIARKKLKVDERRVYLTGHSMGGHGTWHLGALYPDRFAAIGPSAGWISFWSYRPRGEVELHSPIQRMLMRSTLPSRTMDLATNYADLGVYIIHGADDDNVPAEQSRMMVERLSGFHRDFVYHEEPDAGHWWDKSDEDGADCVDWPPLFDFFARHARPDLSEVRDVDFVVPNPGVSSC